jgi:large conductance mechanosensitive channel
MMIKTLQGFRDFIMRGNVIDLAVGIVIGAAFTSVVSSVTDKLLTPLIRALSGGDNLAGTWTVHGQQVDWAAFINALVAFAITAAVLYFFVVLPMNALAERRKRGEVAPPKAPSEEVLLLTEIRDQLVKQNGGVPGQRAATDTEV